jgi:hypothetical protein
MTMRRERELRIRVERFLKGDFRPDDLTRLFLWLRERSFGVASIREIGDFVAHSDEKIKGVVTNEAKTFFRFLRFRSAYIAPDIRPIDLSDLPSDFCDAMRGNIGRVESSLIRRDTGLKRKAGEAYLASALAKFCLRSDGRCELKDAMTPEEFAIVKCCMSYIVSKPAFTARDLVRDFGFVLNKNQLLANEGERKALNTFNHHLTLFAVAYMHHARVILDDGWEANLEAGENEGKLTVNAVAPVNRINGNDLRVGYPMFISDTPLEPWC